MQKGEPKYLRPYLMVGEVLSERYEVVKEFGTGSFGHVICCRDLMDAKGRHVAVKVQDRQEPKYHKDFKCVHRDEWPFYCAVHACVPHANL